MNQERLFQVIQAPIVSEKTAMMMENPTKRQYAFKVAVDATKLEIKKAVEAIFEVEVDAVNTALVKGKSKRFGRFNGRRNDFKKAYVTLKPGSDIQLAAE